MKLRRRPLEVEAITVNEVVAYVRATDDNQYLEEHLRKPVPAVPEWFKKAFEADEIQILSLAGRVWVRSDKHGNTRAYAYDLVARDHNGELFVINSRDVDDLFEEIPEGA